MTDKPRWLEPHRDRDAEAAERSRDIVKWTPADDEDVGREEALPRQEPPRRRQQMRGPAGWYDDPEWRGRQRYWDGSQWTENYWTPPPTRPWSPVPMRTFFSGVAAIVLAWAIHRFLPPWLVAVLVIGGFIVVFVSAALSAGLNPPRPLPPVPFLGPTITWPNGQVWHVKCGTCAFYRDGQCHVGPPQLVNNGQGYPNNRTWSEWPKVGFNDWCQQHAFPGYPPTYFH